MVQTMVGSETETGFGGRMSTAKLYRKRFIPFETVALKNDEILRLGTEQGEEILLTRWNTLRSKGEFTRGYSCIYFNQGFRISRFFKGDTPLGYLYCDIGACIYDPESHSYTFVDYLADVIIFSDGSYKVLDLDELLQAYEANLIDLSIFKKAISTLDLLLKRIHEGKLMNLLPLELQDTE